NNLRGAQVPAYLKLLEAKRNETTGNMFFSGAPDCFPTQPNMTGVLRDVLTKMLETVGGIFSEAVSALRTPSAPPKPEPKPVAERADDCPEPAAVQEDCAPQEKATLSFAEKMREVLKPDEKGNVYEDQLQSAIAAYQLY